MKATKRRQAKAAKALPSFQQLCLMVREVITQHPTDSEADLKEAIKRRHVALGYRYSNDQIPRAMDAVERAMHRYFLSTPQRPPEAPLSEMAQQIDPPWRSRDREPASWTSTRDLLASLTNRHSDPST